MGLVITKFNDAFWQKPKFTLKRALDLAIAIETSEKDVLDLQKCMAQGESLVNKLDGAAKDPKGHEAV